MAEEFTQRIKQMFESSCTVLGLALGGDLGLFKAMSDLKGTFTSEELARTAGCKERYVREWLGTMACSDIIHLDLDEKTFHVSEEKLSCLTGVLPLHMGALPILGQRHNLLKDCFKLDGPDGIDQSDTPNFGQWLDSVRDPIFEKALDEMVLGDVANMKEKLESGITVADVGCGVGKMALMIAERFPNSTVWALDVDKELLKLGNERAKNRNLQNIHFEFADVHELSKTWAAKFDYIFCYDVVHDMPFPKLALAEIYKSLREGGVLSMVEANIHSSLKDNLRDNDSPERVHRHNECVRLYTHSLYICLPHSLSVPNGDGWGRTMGEERAREFLKLAGFEDFTVYQRQMNHFVCRK